MKVKRVTISAFLGEMQVKKTFEPALGPEVLEPNVDDVEKVKHLMRGRMRVTKWPKIGKGTGFTKNGSENETKYTIDIE